MSHYIYVKSPTLRGSAGAGPEQHSSGGACFGKFNTTTPRGKSVSYSWRGHSQGHQMDLDFAAINRAALRQLPTLLNRWCPGGRIQGREYVVLNPTRTDQRPGSFKIVLSGPRAGCWADFAMGDRGGDPVSLAAYLHGLTQSEAARRLAGMLCLREARND